MKIKLSMKRRVINSLLGVLCGFAFAACTENKTDLLSGGDDSVLQLGASVTGLTRANDAGFEAGDSLGVFVVKWKSNVEQDSLLASGNYADNICFRLDKLPNDWIADRLTYYPNDDSMIDLYAYYPYRTPAFGSETVVNLTVASNQSSYRNYTLSDFMVAQTDSVSRSPFKVPLIFDHKLSQMVFELKPGTGFTANDLMNAKVKVMNAITDATFDVAAIKGGTPVAGTTRADIIPCGTWTESGGLLTGMKAIVVPQPINTTTYIQVTIGSRTFTYKPTEAKNMNTGCSRKFIITINNTGLDITTAINPWDNCPLVEGDAEEEFFTGTMEKLNTYCKDNGLMFITGTTYDVDDNRIPFQACDTFLNVKKYGVVLEDGTVKIWEFTKSYGTNSLGAILRAPMLLDNVMAISYGEGSYGNCYMGAVNINTGTIIGFDDSSYKYTTVYNGMYKKADGSLNFYFDAAQTYRHIMTMTIKESSVTFKRGSDYTYNGITPQTNPLEINDLYAKGVAISDRGYSTFWVRTTTNVNDLPSSLHGTTVATLTDKGMYGYIGLKTPEHSGFVCWDMNTNLYEWWSLDGTLIKTLDYIPGSGTFVYRYKNGKIYRSTIGSIALNQYVETDYR